MCLELFTEPKVLPCCHTFCLQCLKKSAQKQGEITCPQCRKTHRIPKGGLGALLTDFIEAYLAYKAEVAGLKASNSHRREKTQICSECEQTGPVGFYCSDCQTYLCAECGLQLHKRLKAYRGHKVIPIDNIDPTILVTFIIAQFTKMKHSSFIAKPVQSLFAVTAPWLNIASMTTYSYKKPVS